MNLADTIDLFPFRIRKIQEDNHAAHLLLIGWGAWSRDRHGIFPPPITPPRIWDEYRSSESYADEGEEGVAVAEQVEVKAERAEEDPYDELQGTILDERMHGPGGLGLEVRRALKVAYVYRYIREDRYPKEAGCSPDGFCERLEAGLQFAGRFV